MPGQLAKRRRIVDRRRLWAGVLAFVLIAGLVAGCGDEPTEAPESTGPTVSGLALLNDRCTECHTLDRVENASMTRDEWSATVEDMIERGAALNDQEKEVLVDYLAETYGP